jgi:hypothetical protein
VVAVLLRRPHLDISSLFGQHVEENRGLRVWRIEEFVPVLVPELEHGHFYEADCYIVLHSSETAGA